MKDHERIWLQNKDSIVSSEGRLWCEDNVWPDCSEYGKPTEYVRADLFKAQADEIERLREALLYAQTVFELMQPDRLHETTDDELASLINSTADAVNLALKGK